MKKIIINILLFTFIILTFSGCQKKEKYYCCDDGYTLKNGQCEKEQYFNVEVLYTCPNGYIAKNDGVCYRSNGQRAMFAKSEYSCLEGGTLINNKCVAVIVTDPYECSLEEFDKNNETNILNENIIIEDYTGKDYNTVKEDLEEKGLYVIVETKNEEGKTNEIIGQSVSEGTELEPKDIITLYIPK